MSKRDTKSMEKSKNERRSSNEVRQLQPADFINKGLKIGANLATIVAAFIVVLTFSVSSEGQIDKLSYTGHFEGSNYLEIRLPDRINEKGVYNPIQCQYEIASDCWVIAPMYELRDSNSDGYDDEFSAFLPGAATEGGRWRLDAGGFNH